MPRVKTNAGFYINVDDDGQIVDNPGTSSGGGGGGGSRSKDRNGTRSGPAKAVDNKYRGDPTQELRKAAGFGDNSNATGSEILAGGGDPIAGAISLVPGRDNKSARSSKKAAKDTLETAGRLASGVSKLKEAGEKASSSGSNSPSERAYERVTEGEGSLPPVLRIGTGGLLAVVGVGYLALKAFGGR